VRPVLRTLLVLLPLLCAGCGYTSRSLVPENYGTVGVEIFGNASPVIDLEREMHAQITRSIRDLVDVRLVDPRQADLVMRGRIIDYRRRRGVRSPENKLLETGLIISVEASLYDRRKQAEVAAFRPAPIAVGYLVGDIENELEARARAIHNVAEQLVLDLFGHLD